VYIDLRILHPLSQKPMVSNGKYSAIANSGKLTPFLLDINPINGKILKTYGVIGNYLVASTKY
jgi:hypothetical protein